MPRKNPYVGGIIGASPLDDSGTARRGVSNLGALSGDNANGLVRPTRRWGGMTGRSLVASSAAAPVVGDPHWDNVALLLQGNSLIDKSKYGHTLSASSQISTQTSPTTPFGQSSIQVANSNNALFTTGNLSSPPIGTGDFTIEYFVYQDSVQNYHTHFGSRTGGGTWLNQAANTFSIGASSNTTTAGALFIHRGQTPPASQILASGSTAFTRQQWHYVAAVRSSGTWALWLNGTRVDTDSFYSGVNFSANAFGIGTGATTKASSERLRGHIMSLRFTVGVARYNPASTSISVPTYYFPMRAAVTGSGATVFSNGVLSLPEALQSKYVAPAPAASTSLVFGLWGGGGGGGATHASSSASTEDSGSGGNGAYVEAQVDNLPANAVIKRYVGGGGQAGVRPATTSANAHGGSGGAATIVVIENAAGTEFLAVAVAGGGGGGGGAGGAANADATPGAGGAAVDTTTGLTTTPQDSAGVGDTNGGDAAGGGTATSGGAHPTPNGKSSSSEGTDRITANGLTIAQDGGRASENHNDDAAGSNYSHSSVVAGGLNGSPYRGRGGNVSNHQDRLHGEGDGGGGGGGWYGGSGGGAALKWGESGSGGGGGSSYVNVGTHTFDGQSVTITARASAAGLNQTGSSAHNAVDNASLGYFSAATINTGKGGRGRTTPRDPGYDGEDGAVHTGQLDGNLYSAIDVGGAAADLIVSDILP